MDTSSDMETTATSSSQTTSTTSCEKRTSPTTDRIPQEDIALLAHLAALARASGASFGDSGIVWVAKKWGLEELEREAMLLSEQFLSFASAVNKAVTELESRA